MSTKTVRKSHNRLPGYNYSQLNYYFITICSENRLELFGKIENNEMVMNDAGRMIEQILLEIPCFYPAISLDTYVVMPNHIHAIIIINNQILLNNGQTQGSVPTYSNISLSNLIQRIKMLSTKKYIAAVKNNQWPPFNKKIWQRSFHDHIIRNNRSLKEIREYIVKNPANWDEDAENKNSINRQRISPGQV
ncbi:MAG: transposase [Candidatus Omnitrophica bacterium]|nr:transposase [Candidatus Omnitrophota bacterium]